MCVTEFRMQDPAGGLKFTKKSVKSVAVKSVKNHGFHGFKRLPCSCSYNGQHNLPLLRFDAIDRTESQRGFSTMNEMRSNHASALPLKVADFTNSDQGTGLGQGDVHDLTKIIGNRKCDIYPEA